MGYILLGGILLFALLPISIHNQTAYRKKQISKKAARYRIDLNFEEK